MFPEKLKLQTGKDSFHSTKFEQHTEKEHVLLGLEAQVQNTSHGNRHRNRWVFEMMLLVLEFSSYCLKSPTLNGITVFIGY
jgi:hypothetical protein